MCGMQPAGRSIRIILAAILALAFAGCSAQDAVRKFAPPNEVAVARQYFDLLAAGNLELIASLLPSNYENAKIKRRQVHDVYALLPREHPSKMDLINAVNVWNVNSNEPVTYNFTFENSYSHSLLVFNIIFQHHGPGIIIYGINVTPISETIQRRNAFTLLGKGPIQYAGALFAVAIPLFMIWTAIGVVRTPFRKRTWGKWLWFCFVLLGLTTFQINWTTGQFQTLYFTFQVLGVSMTQAADGFPWILSVSLPIGAIIFWTRRSELVTAASLPDPPQVTSTALPAVEEWLQL